MEKEEKIEKKKREEEEDLEVLLAEYSIDPAWVSCTGAFGIQRLMCGNGMDG